MSKLVKGRASYHKTLLQYTRKKDGVKLIVGKDFRLNRFNMFWSGNDNGPVELEFSSPRNGGRGCLRWSESQTGLFSLE